MTLLGDLLRLGIGIGFMLKIVDILTPAKLLHTSIVFIVIPFIGIMTTDKKILLLAALCVYLIGYAIGVVLGATAHEILDHSPCAHSLYTILL